MQSTWFSVMSLVTWSDEFRLVWVFPLEKCWAGALSLHFVVVGSMVAAAPSAVRNNTGMSEQLVSESGLLWRSCEGLWSLVMADCCQVLESYGFQIPCLFGFVLSCGFVLIEVTPQPQCIHYTYVCIFLIVPRMIAIFGLIFRLHI